MLSAPKLLTNISPPSGFIAKWTGVEPTSSNASTRSGPAPELFDRLLVFRETPAFVSTLFDATLGELKFASPITATCADPLHATKAFVPSGLMASSVGA